MLTQSQSCRLGTILLDSWARESLFITLSLEAGLKSEISKVSAVKCSLYCRRNKTSPQNTLLTIIVKPRASDFQLLIALTLLDTCLLFCMHVNLILTRNLVLYISDMKKIFERIDNYSKMLEFVSGFEPLCLNPGPHSYLMPLPAPRLVTGQPHASPRIQRHGCENLPPGYGLCVSSFL